MHQFQPSHYSHPLYNGASYGDGMQTTSDVVKVTGATAGGLATGAAAGSLLVGAGAAATVPVAGWIVGGVLAGAAGTVALVGAIRDGKVRQEEAVKAAQKLGFGSLAKKVPAFTVDALKWDKAKRTKKLAQYREKYARMKKKKGVVLGLWPKAHKRNMAVVKTKIRILEAIAKAKAPKKQRSKLKADEQRALRLVEQSPKVTSSVSEMSKEQAAQAAAGAASLDQAAGLIPGVPNWALYGGLGVAGLLVVGIAMKGKGGSGGGGSTTIVRTAAPRTFTARRVARKR